jgi:hypothetical protein
MVRNLVVSAFVSLFLSSVVCGSMFYFFIPDFKTVSIEKMVSNHVEKVGKKFDMSDDEVKEYSAAFSTQIEKSIDFYYEKDNSIILVQPAVIRGAEDITNKVYAHVLKEINDE